MENNENEKKVEVQNKKKSNFVPSYANKDKEASTNSNVKTKKSKKIKIKSKFSIAIIVAVIVVIALLIYFLVFKNGNKNSNYEELMQDYGLAMLYNNGEVDANQDVTKAEAIKMILAVTLNTEDIGDFLSSDVEEEYPNSRWVYYAKAIELISESDITPENYNDTEEYINIIRYLGNAKSKILNKTLDVAVEPKFKDYNSYSPDERWAISDMVYNQIIADSTDELNAKTNLKKATLNKIIIEYALKYNLLTVNGEKININKDKMPANADEFPYTLATINKSVYETPNYIANEENYKNARKSFSEMKKNYQNIDELINSYFKALMNVNYETIDKDNNTEIIADATNHILSLDDYEEYVKYIKDNKVVMNGEVKVQYPIIYFDGINYRVRVKLDINIEKADKLQNLVYGDTNQEYKQGKNEIYVDIPLYYSNVNENYFIEYRKIENMISGKVIEEKVEVEEEEINQTDEDDNEEVENIEEEEMEYIDSSSMM